MTNKLAIRANAAIGKEIIRAANSKMEERKKAEIVRMVESLIKSRGECEKTIERATRLFTYFSTKLKAINDGKFRFENDQIVVEVDLPDISDMEINTPSKVYMGRS